MKTALATLAIALGLSACDRSANYVFTNGRVYTVNEAQPWAEAVAVRRNEIVYVGDAAGAEAFVGSGTEVIDLDGKMLLPGFVSAHDHLIASNWTNLGADLFDARSKEEALAIIREFAEANPDDKVVRGIGWSRGTFGGRLPTAQDLDEAVSDRPAIILDFTIHDAWLNTAALEAGNVTRDSPDAVPGVTYWVRDEAGNPTGVAIEIQWMGTYIAAGGWEPETMIRASAEKLFAIAVRNGTTTFLNPGLVTPNIKDVHGGMESDFRATMAGLAEMAERGELPLRAQVLPMFKTDVGDPERFAAFAKEMSEQYDSDMLSVRSVKIHPEGNWVAEVAPFIEPYANNPDNRGAFNVPPELSKQVVLAANAVGLDVMIHTDGDASTRAAIDAFEAAIEAGHTDRRNALHHLMWAHPDDQRRIVEMKIPVNTTPSFSNDWSGQRQQALELLGEERVNSSLGRYTSLAREGVSVSISADVPSTMPDMQAPLFVVEAAVTLQEPSDPNSKRFPPQNEGMTVEQALRAMTIDAAWQMRMEDVVGSIEVGKYADLVVLDQSPFDVAPRDIADIEVLMTMMDGRFTYLASEAEELDIEDEDRWLTPAEMTVP